MIFKAGPTLLIAAVSLSLYAPALAFHFAHDDYFQILRNPLIANPDHAWQTLLAPFASATYPGDLYRPLTMATFRLNVMLFGPDPFFFHLVNLLLHAACALLAYVLALAALSSRPVALSAALLFAVHPMHVETVAGVVGRAELLAALFVMLSCWYCRRSLDCNNRTGRLVLLLLAGLFLLFAALSKESALTGVMLAPLFAWLAGERSRAGVPPLLPAVLALLLAAAAALAMRGAVLGQNFIIAVPPVFTVENPLLNLGFFARLFPALAILGRYMAQLIVPLQLSADYSMVWHHFFVEIWGWQGAGWLSLLLLYMALLRLRWREPEFVFGLWFLVAFALTSNILIPIGTVAADRLAYLPSIGFLVWLCALAARALPRRPALLCLIAVLVVCFYSFRTRLRLPAWQNNRTLYASMALSAPYSPKAQSAYAGILLLDEERPAEARIYLERAYQLDPENLQLLKALIALEVRQQDFKLAAAHCRQGLTLAPDDAELKAMLDWIADRSPDNH